MGKFIYNDFVSEELNGCPLTKSQQVKEVVSNIIEQPHEITDIRFIGMLFQNTLLYEWWISLTKDNEPFLLRLPLYMPRDQKKAASYIKLHNEAYQNGEFCVFEENTYILVNNHPCHLLVDEQDNIEIKKIVLWPSQKMIQEYAELITKSPAAASLALIRLKHTNGDDLFDIGWMICCDEQETLISIDAGQLELYPGTWISDFEPFPHPYFHLNGQKYSIAEDDENGQFIFKDK